VRILILGLCALVPASLTAQQWGDPVAMALVSRAVARRSAAEGEGGLRSWQVRAHGVVLFQAQLGESPDAPTRLVKADELDVEVYWSAPGRSKQVIRRWRDRRYLPTDIRYHRDHLGIVTDGFGPVIRIGDGDEVRDVPHPLSDSGLVTYEFARIDSATVLVAHGRVDVDVVAFRPRDPSRPGAIGTLYLDRGSAELARARFTFTPASYIDATVEELTVLLDYARVEDVAWLPWRQTVEIRRNTGWLDLPYRGVIRGSWEFGDYTLDAAIPAATFLGLPIGGLFAPRNGDTTWSEPFDSALTAAGPVATGADVAAAREQVMRAVEGRVARSTPKPRAAVGGVSDLLRYNRVQGVAVGFGVVSRGSWVVLKPKIGIGLADGRVTGGLTASIASHDPRPTTLDLFADRSIRDFSDLPVISGVLNSLTAQEGGDDHGDYVMVEQVGVRLSIPVAREMRLASTIGYVDPASLGIAAFPANGTVRSQQSLGGDGYWTGAFALSTEGSRGGDDVGFDWRVEVEGGAGASEWGRATAEIDGVVPFVGTTTLGIRGYGGSATSGVPAWRTFVLGGRGTLLGEEFRAWGGRDVAWGSLEWRIPVPVPAIGLGDFVSTGRTAVVAPFLAAGWADDPVSGLSWTATHEPRLTAGVALELLYRLVRIEAGASLQTGDLGVTFDVGRIWWGAL
jgi:hypothetical protein